MKTKEEGWEERDHIHDEEEYIKNFKKKSQIQNQGKEHKK